MKQFERLKKMEYTLSGLSGYDGWMIGKCSVFFDAEKTQTEGWQIFSYQMQIIRESRKAVLIEISSPAGADRMQVLLICPRSEKGISAPNDIETYSGKNLFAVSKEEIHAYLTESGDQNPIHRGENPIVPGFLMMNLLIQRIELFEPVRQIEVRFLAPLKSCEGAEMRLERETGTVRGGLFKAGCEILQIKISG